MQLEVYTHILNINLFNKGEAIIVSPVPNGPYDVQILIKLNKVIVNSNSSALYITRNYNTDRLKRWLKKRKVKKNVQSKRN